MLTQFTSLIEEKLSLHNYPEVVQELIVNELCEIVLRKVYGEIVSNLKDDEAERVYSLMEAGDLENLYGLLTENDRNEKIAINAAEEVIEEFLTQMKAGA